MDLMHLIKMIIIDLIILLFTVWLGFYVGWLIAKTLFPSVPLENPIKGLQHPHVTPSWIDWFSIGITAIIGTTLFFALEMDQTLRPIIFFVDIQIISIMFASSISSKILHALYLFIFEK